MKIAFVRWVDSCGYHHEIRTERVETSMRMESAGLVVVDEPHGIALAQDWTPGEFEWRNVIGIPREAIREVKYYEVDDAPETREEPEGG